MSTPETSPATTTPAGIPVSELSVFVHIVTYQSGTCLFRCLEALNAPSEPSISVKIRVTENGSDRELLAEVERRFGGQVETTYNPVNIGFAGAHNQGVAQFLQSECDLYLALNPDVEITRTAIFELAAELRKTPNGALATPLLLRSNSSGQSIIDAAGMELLPSLRHLDRGSEQPFTEQYSESECVFGGTGAALLLSRSGIEKLLLRGACFDADMSKVFPQLEPGRLDRSPLFDEAFFAYREDADLAWRAHHLGLSCVFVPAARALHGRRVTPDRRSSLPPELNQHSVRNRFLLQINNFFPTCYPRAVLPGLVVRNLLVIIGVLVRERSSLPAFHQVWQLRRRQWERRKMLGRALKT